MQMMMQHTYPQPVAPHQIYRTISESQALNIQPIATSVGCNPMLSTESIGGLVVAAGGSGNNVAAGQAAQQRSNQASVKFGRILSKKASRVKEIMLQNIGKADKSNDAIFQMYELNFYKQHNQASKLFKLFKAHYKSLKLSQESGRNLNVCIEEISADYQVARHDLICDGLSSMENLREAHMDKLRQRILYDLSQFNNNFTNLKAKIAKRRRKQIDHDAAKRLYDFALAELNKKRANDAGVGQQNDNNNVVEQNNSNQQQQSLAGKMIKSIFKSQRADISATQAAELGGGALDQAASRLVEEARVLKLREQYNYCKIMFETVNSELSEELPMLYECKMKQILSLLHSYFSLGAKYHSECSRLMSSSGHAIEELPFAMIARHQSGASSQASGNNCQTQQQEQEHTGSSDEFNEDDDDDEDEDDEDDEDDDIGLDSSSVMSSNNKQQDTAALETSFNQKIALKEQQQHHAEEDCKAVVASSGSSSGNSSRGDSASVSGKGSPDNQDRSSFNHDDQTIKSVMESSDGKPIIEIGNLNDVLGSILGKAGTMQDSSSVVAVPDPESIPKHIHDVEPEIVNGTIFPINTQSIEADRDIKMEEIGFASAATQQDSTVNPSIQITTTSTSKPLYKVKTQFKYLAEDVDELCFEADEIIQVIEFEPSQEPEEGWLMGVREVNGQKGLFPANFTKPI